jgi:hypothetical protein
MPTDLVRVQKNHHGLAAPMRLSQSCNSLNTCFLGSFVAVGFDAIYFVANVAYTAKFIGSYAEFP